MRSTYLETKEGRMSLKMYYDDVIAANDRVSEVMDQMNELYKSGDKAGAMELKPALEEAKLEARKVNELYVSLVDAVQQTGKAKAFVPVSEGVVEAMEDGKVVTREVFDGMEPVGKAAFLAGGGKIRE
jgi:hypothetical protein